MLWIIISILLIVAGLVFLKSNDYNEDGVGAMCCFTVVALIVSAAPISTGMNDVHELSIQKATIEALQSEVSNVRASYYETKSTATMIEGNIANQGTGKSLMDYSKTIASHKVKYNTKLAEAKIYKTYWVYKFFKNGLFIPDKVLNMSNI
jgi:hypothetical protein